MVIKLTHEKKPLKAKKYTRDGCTMSFAIDREDCIRMWNAGRFEKLFYRITQDANKERRNICQMFGRMGRTDTGYDRNGRTRRTTPRFVENY